MDYEKKSTDQLLQEIANLKAELQSLQLSYSQILDDQKRIEKKSIFKNEFIFHLKLSGLFDNSEFDINKVLSSIIELVPYSFQFPDLIQLSVSLNNKSYQTASIKKSFSSLKKLITVNGNVIGSVELHYAEYLELSSEESEFINSISARIGHYLEKKEADAALRASQVKYQNLVENINDVIFETNDQGIITYISRPIENITQFTVDEIIGKSLSFFIGGDNAFLQKRSEALQLTGKLENEYEITTKNGDKRWLRTSTKPKYDNGIFTGSTGTLVDITEKKLMELELQKSELLYKSILNASPDSVTITDNYGTILLTSPKAVQVFGNENTKSFVGQSVLNYIALEDHEKAVENIRKIQRGIPFTTVELKGLKVDGTKFDIEVSGDCIKNPNGEPGNMVFITRDITERKRVKKELVKSEESYRNLVNSINDVLYEVDYEGIIKYITPSIKFIIGIPAEEIIGTSFINYVYESDRSLILQKFRSLDHKDYAYLEYRLVNREGNTCWIRSSTNPIIENGKVIGGTGVLIDVTERKIAEEKILKAKRLYALLSHINQAIIHLRNKEALLMEVCQISTGLGEFQVAWAGLKDKATNMIVPTACNGFEELFLSCLHPIDLGNSLDEKSKVLLNGKPFQSANNVENCSMHKNGACKHACKSAITMPILEHGEVVGAYSLYSTSPNFFNEEEISLLHEITSEIGFAFEAIEIEAKNKLAQDELRKLSSAVEQSPVSIFITNLNGNIEYANPKSCETLGCSLNELIGKDHSYFITNETLKNDHLKIWNSLKHGPWKGVLQNQRKNGEYFWEMSTITPIIDPQGNATNYIAIKEDITERIKDQQALQVSENALNYAQEISKMGSWEYNYVTDKLSWSNNYFRLLGFNVNEFEPRNEVFFDMIHPGDIAFFDKKINQIYETKQPVTFEFRLVMKDGTIKWIQNNIVPVYEGDTLITLKGVNLDITEKKQNENEIKMLSLAVEQSPVSITITDLNAHIEYVNPAFVSTTGYSRDELLGQRTNILNSGKFDKAFFADLWNTIKAGQVWQGELINKKKNGELFWENATITPIYNDKGEMSNYLAVKQDITLRKLAEIEIKDLNANLEIKIAERTAQLEETNEVLLHEIEERRAIEDSLRLKTTELQNFFDVTLDLLCIADTSGNFKKVNKAWENILGYSTIDLESRKFLEFIHPDDMPDTMEIMKLLEAQKEVINFTNRYKDKQGNYRFIEWRSVPVGKNIYAAARDITDRIKFEDEIKMARQEAEQANMAKSEFLSRMSHELRTPMNSILGFAQLMQMSELNPGQKKGVNHIMKSGKHLLDLINEVLDISRIEAGRLSLSLEPVQVGNIITEMMDIVRPQANARKLTLELLSSENNILFVKSDKQRLKQVLLNLLNNAIKYNKPEGSVLISVEKAFQNGYDPALIRISVTDTGVGISKENIPKLFKPFERIGAEKTETEGTGLGLAVVKKIMDAVGGNVGVFSTAEEGSTFWIELPLCESQLNAGKISSIENLKPSLSSKKGTILYVEDNASNIELVEQILASQRSDILLKTCIYGKNAVLMAKEIKPDLILLDLNLPDIHGNEVLKSLLSNSSTSAIPVVIISADALPQQLDSLKKAGAKDYLTKPLDVIGLLKVIDTYLDV